MSESRFKLAAKAAVRVVINEEMEEVVEVVRTSRRRSFASTFRSSQPGLLRQRKKNWSLVRLHVSKDSRIREVLTINENGRCVLLVFV